MSRRSKKISDAVSTVAETIANTVVKANDKVQEKKNKNKNVVAKYNYRLKKMQEQGVDMGYVYGKLKETIGEDMLTKSGNIRTKGITEQNLRALEAQLPEEKAGGEYDYGAFREKIEKEKEYRRQQEEERERKIQQKRYRDAMDQQINRFLDAIYDSRDEKTRDFSDSWYSFAGQNSELADEIWEELTGMSFEKWNPKKTRKQGKKGTSPFPNSLASRIARDDISPEEVDRIIDSWVERGLVIPD